MNYIVYHKDTTRYLSNHPNVKTNLASFGSRGAAAAALTREVNRGAVKREDFDITDSVTFHQTVEKTVTVKSLMSGADVQQHANTPHCCDVSQETYWSM